MEREEEGVREAEGEKSLVMVFSKWKPMMECYAEFEKLIQMEVM